MEKVKVARGFSLRLEGQGRISERVFVEDAVLDMLAYSPDEKGSLLYTLVENSSYDSGAKFSHKRLVVSRRLNKSQYFDHAEKVLSGLLERVRRERAKMVSYGSAEG